MGSPIDALFSVANNSLFETHSEPVRYVDRANHQVDIQAIVERRVTRELTSNSDDNPPVTIIVKRSDRRIIHLGHDHVYVDGHRYVVSEILDRQGEAWVLRCSP